ncbi:MAG TPA: glutathione S-transferase family protein [Bordetella sp.]
MLTLFDHPRSGNCYKVRLFCSLAGIAYRSVFIDVLGRKNRSAEFQAISPFCQVPAVRDGDDVVWDSQAILVYLAQRYARQWMPDPDAIAFSHMHQWLSVSSNEIANSLQPLRLVYVVDPDEAAHHLGVSVEKFDLDGCIARSRRLLQCMERHLHGRTWLAGNAPTIADIACHGYLSRAHETHIDMSDYPAVQAWNGHLQDLPGYLGMEASAHPASRNESA